ncbi:MAG: endo-1,4-beta-xylanase [Armatimonadetes bacterium]|nr:endo-1,4-beta-xylanase [Armatimonadota bacterium]
MSIFSLLCAATLTHLGTPGSLADPPGLSLQNPRFESKLQGWSDVPAERASVRFEPAPPNIGGKAAVFTTAVPAGADPWSVEIKQSVTAPVVAGERLEFSFYAKAKSDYPIVAHIQQSSPPYTGLGSRELTVSGDWRRYSVRGTAPSAFPAGSWQVAIHLGKASGEISIAGCKLERVLPDPATREKPVVLLKNAGLLWESDSTNGWTAKVTGVTGQKFSQAAQLTTKVTEGMMPWSINVRQWSSGAVGSGSLIVGKIWMRAHQPMTVSTHFELGSPPHDKSASSNFQLSTKWQEYTLFGKALQDLAAGEARLVVFLGHESGTVELGPVEVLNYGATSPNALGLKLQPYGAAAVNDAWRKAAFERIETHRKGDLAISVTDTNGNPLPGAEVELRQVQSEFRWGTAGPAERLLSTDADAVKYQAILQEFFNTFTFENDLKWGDGKPSPEEMDRAIDWLYSRNFKVKGHNFVWGSQRWLPSGMMQLSEAELKARIEQRVREHAARYKDRQFWSWDAINEAVTERELWDKIGWDQFDNVFKWAKEVDPKTPMVYNDYNWTEEAEVGSGHRERAIEIVRERMKAGAPIDKIGIQYHVRIPATPMPRVLEILGELDSKLGLPLEITEYDFSCLDDESHAQHMEDSLIAMFSHPSVDSFILWGFWEGRHWRPEAAMFRRDWSERPAVSVYRKWVVDTWRTNATLKTDAQGTSAIRAFGGEYVVKISAAGKQPFERKIRVKAGTKSVLSVALL